MDRKSKPTVFSTPIGFSNNLLASRIMRTWVDDTELVIWRSESGRLSAWENRCPHRGMRLSYGFVRGESLACIYHGWQYGREGTCKLIPAHPELNPPKNISTVRYKISEQQGIIWVSIQDKSTVPNMDENLHPLRTISVESSQSRIIKRIVDLTLLDENNIQLFSNDNNHYPEQIRFKSKDSQFKVIMLAQFISTDSTNIHLLCSKNWSTEGMIGLSKWIESARHLIETDNDTTGPAQ